MPQIWHGEAFDYPADPESGATRVRLTTSLMHHCNVYCEHGYSSPDGRRIATSNQDYRIRLYDAGTGDYLLTVGAHESVATSVAFSPDGRTLAFVGADAAGTSHLYLRALEAPDARVLTGTEGAMLPFWSPDGSRLGFFASGNLHVIAVSGGSPVALAPAPAPRGGTWSRDDRILFVGQPHGPPSLVPASGGTRPTIM